MIYLILSFIMTRFFRGEQSRISVHCAEQGSPPGRRQRLGMGARLACGVRSAEACRAQSREEPPGRRGQGGTEGGSLRAGIDAGMARLAARGLDRIAGAK